MEKEKEKKKSKKKAGADRKSGVLRKVLVLSTKTSYNAVKCFHCKGSKLKPKPCLLGNNQFSPVHSQSADLC
jgi:hypothetical protein